MHVLELTVRNQRFPMEYLGERGRSTSYPASQMAPSVGAWVRNRRMNIKYFLGLSMDEWMDGLIQNNEM